MIWLERSKAWLMVGGVALALALSIVLTLACNGGDSKVHLSTEEYIKWACSPDECELELGYDFDATVAEWQSCYEKFQSELENVAPPSGLEELHNAMLFMVNNVIDLMNQQDADERLEDMSSSVAIQMLGFTSPIWEAQENLHPALREQFQEAGCDFSGF